ncbi:MAG: hypothetical protein PVF74_08450 [Anaerolineales bacterium]|jgi:hypothetical protein
MKYLCLTIVVLTFVIFPSSTVDAAVTAAEPTYSGYPTFSILEVVRDKNVTIKTYNLPANDHFRVRMGYMGTRGVNGIIVTSFGSGSGGSKEYTFDIPSKLEGLYKISIRIESKTGSGYYAYNWFYNNTTNGSSTSGSSKGKGRYSGYPTFSIVSVKRNKSVTIKTNNLPPNDEFRVRMGYMGTRGVGGIKVISFGTDSGGKKKFTFNIPSELHGQYKIAIRIESKTGSGYYAYNWFYNNTTP